MLTFLGINLNVAQNPQLVFSNMALVNYKLLHLYTILSFLSHSLTV